MKHSKAVTEPVMPIGETVTAGPIDSAPVPPVSEDPRQTIELIAYGYWAERGYQGGEPSDDWFRAEAEYRRRSVSV